MDPLVEQAEQKKQKKAAEKNKAKTAVSSEKKAGTGGKKATPRPLRREDPAQTALIEVSLSLTLNEDLSCL